MSRKNINRQNTENNAESQKAENQFLQNQTEPVFLFFNGLNVFLIEFFACLLPGIFCVLSFYFVLYINRSIFYIYDKNHSFTANYLDLDFFAKPNGLTYISLITLSYIVGFLFFRRKTDIPDFVSQILIAVNRIIDREAPSVFFGYSILFFTGSFPRFAKYYSKIIKKTCRECSLASKVSEKNEVKDLKFTHIIKAYIRSSWQIIIILFSSIFLIFYKQESTLLSQILLISPISLSTLTIIIYTILKIIKMRSRGYDTKYLLCESSKLANHVCNLNKSKICRFPYEDYFSSYLNERKLKWLTNCKYWDEHSTTKRKFDTIKIRINHVNSNLLKQANKIESYIRLSSTLWHITRTIGLICLSLSLYCLYLNIFNNNNDVFNANTFNNIPSLIIFNFSCAISFCYMNYLSAKSIHYLRMKEIYYVLEIVCLLKNDRSSNNSSLFDDILKTN